MPFLAPLIPVVVGAVASAAASKGISALSGSGSSKPGNAQGLENPLDLSGASLSDTYQGNQDALKSQQNLLTALQGQNGIQNQSNVYNQLQGVANGTGPNPAQAMLNQATGQNVANQAALAAGQRGAASNVGLLARQAAQQGSQAQQQAAGQGATLQANQSLNALGQLSGVAGQQVNQQMQATQQNTLAQQAEQQQLLQAQQAYNNNLIGQQGSINAANAGANTVQAQGNQNIAGGIAQGIGSVAGSVFGGGSAPALLKSNATPGMAEGGNVAPVQGVPQGPVSSLGRMLQARQQAPMMAQGGKVNALLSPGEKYLSPQAVQQVKAGADPMKVGQTIPGSPKVSGAKNSYANDNVPRQLDVGGIVVPRSSTQSANPSRNSKDFVAKTLAKKKVK